MTAKEIIDRALGELGYLDFFGNPDSNVKMNIALSCLNSIYAELFYCLNSDGFKSCASVNDKVDLPERILNDCMHYGVGMSIAAKEGDIVMQQNLCDIYNIKLGALNKGEKIGYTMSRECSL